MVLAVPLRLEGPGARTLRRLGRALERLLGRLLERLLRGLRVDWLPRWLRRLREGLLRRPLRHLREGLLRRLRVRLPRWCGRNWRWLRRNGRYGLP